MADFKLKIHQILRAPVSLEKVKRGNGERGRKRRKGGAGRGLNTQLHDVRTRQL